MPDYSLCKVYRIVSDIGQCQYIGSTSQKYLSQRMNRHCIDYKKWLKKEFHYITVFDVLKYGDAKIILIDAYPDCKTSDEQRMYEDEWIQAEHCVNKRCAYVSPEARKEYHREHWKTYGPTYREENREKTCECGVDSLFDHKSRHERSRAHLEWATLQVAAN